jgi:hypothetical protein
MMRSWSIVLPSLAALSTAFACAATQSAELKPSQSVPDDRLAQLHERARSIAHELGQLGFPIKISEVTLSLNENAPAGQVSRGGGDTDEPSEVDSGAFDTLRELLGAKDDESGFGGVALAYYDIGGQYVVFNDAQLGRSGDADQIVAHELVHVYQDQVQGGSETYSRVHRRGMDRTLAAHAVSEGEAQLIARALMYKRAGADLKVRDPRIKNDGLSRLLAESGVGGPYVLGEDFLWARYRVGGFEAVLAAYHRPPSSTEQLLHPDKYERDLPRIVTLPDWPDPTALVRRTAEESFGEYAIFAALAESLTVEDDPLLRGSDEAALASVGWDGDRMAVYRLHDGRRAALFRSVWDSDEAARAFLTAVRRALVLHEREGSVRVAQRAAVVDLAYSEDTSLLPALVQALEQHPRHFPPSVADRESTRRARQDVAERIALAPKVEHGTWLHPLSAVRVCIPDGWKPRPLLGVPVIAGDASHGVTPYIAAQQVTDLHAGDLGRFLDASVTQIRQSSLNAGEVARELRDIGGVHAGVLTLTLGRKKPTTLRIWVLPRAGHYFLLGLRMSAEAWPDEQALVRWIERGISLTGTPAASASTRNTRSGSGRSCSSN